MRLIAPLIFLCSLVVVGNRSSEATPIVVTVNTAAIAGTAAQLAFDFIDGGPPSNSVAISNFATDGTVGTSAATGDVSGSLPGTFTLSDAAFFNELLTNITLGTTLSFTFDATANAPGVSSVPDSFSFFLVDPASGLSLFPTTDPTGADALLQLDIVGGAGNLTPFTAPNGEATITVGAEPTAVPEPATLVLFLTGLGGALRCRRNRLSV